MKVEILTSDAGDWLHALVDGVEVHRGHSMSDWDWASIVRKLGHECVITEVPGDTLE